MERVGTLNGISARAHVDVYGDCGLWIVVVLEHSAAQLLATVNDDDGLIIMFKQTKSI